MNHEDRAIVAKNVRVGKWPESITFWVIGSGIGTQVVAAAAMAAGLVPVDETFSWANFLGPFHMVLLHLPIGMLSFALLLELLLWRWPSNDGRRILGLLLGVSALSAVTTIGLGYLRASTGNYSPDLLEWHRNFGFAVGGLTVMTWIHHFFLPSTPAPVRLLTHRLMLGAAAVALAVAGHGGGSLTHGSQFLSEHAPGFLKPLLEPSHAGPSTPKPKLTSKPLVRRPGEADVASILAAKCLSCHGPEKQKSAFRVDQPDILMRGGKSGQVAVVPGDPLKSNLLRVVLLPRDHDEAMPPEGKSPLTVPEIAALIHWIQSGAP